MAEKLDPEELVSFKELLMSEGIQSDALINLLNPKGIITKKELLEEMEMVQASIPNTKKVSILSRGNHDRYRNH
jgi:hypothetical protein